MGKEKTILSDPDSTAVKNKKQVYGFLVSRLPYPVELCYDGKCVMMPPRGRLEGIEKSKLAKLKDGITFIAQNK